MSSRERAPRKVLVVDDDRILAITTSLILKKEGYAVAVAFSGEEAVERAKTFSPDLLLSDIWMDTMSGIEAASRIAAKLPGVKILFLSGDATISDVLSIFPKRIVYSLMAKPVRVRDLLNAVAYMLPEVKVAHVSTQVEMSASFAEDPHQNGVQDSSVAAEEQGQFLDPGRKFPVRSVDPRNLDQEDLRKGSGFPSS